MTVSQKIYEQLRKIDDPCVDQAMAAALPSADPQARRLICLSLLERHQPEGLIGLVLAYHLLEPDLQVRIARHITQLYRPLREAAGRKRGDGPANAMRLIAAAGEMRLAYLIGDQLQHGSGNIRHQAAACLLELTRDATMDVSQTSDSTPTHTPHPPTPHPPTPSPHTPSPATPTPPATTHAQPIPLAERINRADTPHQPTMPRPIVCATEAAYLLDTLAEAVKRFSVHEELDVLRAVAIFSPRPIPHIDACLIDPHHPATIALAGLLAQGNDEPDLDRLRIQKLTSPVLSAAALYGLIHGERPERLAALCDYVHLLLPKPARRALEHMEMIASMIPTPSQLETFTPNQACGLPRYLNCLPLSGPDKIKHIASLARMTDPSVRLAAACQLIKLADEGFPTPTLTSKAANLAIVDCVFDKNIHVALVALRHLMRIGDSHLGQLLPKLINGRDDRLSQVAREHLAARGFARLWETWPTLTPPQRVASGRALIKIDPSFHRLLAQKLSVPDPEIRLRSLSMIATLGQGHLFEPALLLLAQQSRDTKLISTAVMALGSCDSDAAKQSLEKALDHADSRVRANAVEALDQHQSTNHVEKLISMTDDDANRPRANAIASLMQLRTADALAALHRMLDDDRPAQRVSGLWVVEHMGVMDMAKQVAEMSIRDRDRRVKGRASRVIQQLIAELRGKTKPTVNETGAA